jgi:hypothetical protein
MTIILNGTTGISGVDGTASQPAVQGNDADTGVFFPAANTVAISTNGTEALRVDSSGAFRVKGAGTAGSTDALQISGSAPASAMLLDFNGNLGVGSTSPLAKVQADSSSSTYSANIRARNSNFGNGVIGAASGILTVATDMNNLAFYTTSNLGVDGTSAPTNERARIDSSGNLLVGTTNSQARLTAWDTSTSVATARIFKNVANSQSAAAILIDKYDNTTTTSQIFVQFTVNNQGAGSGQINANGANTAAFGTYSDARLKENIVDLPPQLNNILALRPCEFDYIESEGGGHQIGFIAQEMQTVYPDAVGERADGMLTVTAWSKTEARLVKAIQELSAKNDALEARIAALEAN